jgi:putative addiction module component (TIGR02574 family)
MSIYTADELIQAALKLPASDRLRISMELSDSVASVRQWSEEDPDLAEELNRRSAAYRSGEMTSSTWDEVNARLIDQLKQARTQT